MIKPNSLQTLTELGMPLHKTPYQFGNLSILFKVEFPKKIDPAIHNSIKGVLPKAKENTEKDASETAVLEEYNEATHGRTGHGGEDDSDEEQDEGMGGQRVQCAQQ